LKTAQTTAEVGSEGNKLSVSVIVCTHNPRPDYFDRTLAGLRSQTLPVDRWELLIIDNASTPEKEPRPDLSWHPTARLLLEMNLGLTPARLCGIHEATGDLLIFVDDDNVLDADFLATAQRVAEEMPFLGSWSGQCRPEFDEPPPEWTRRYWGNLVIREFESDVWSNLPRLAATMPCGAGLCVRRAVAQYYIDLHLSGKRSFQLDRTGDALISGGDNDLAACGCALGLGVGLIASLKLTHLVPPERLTENYLAKLAEGIQHSGAVLDYYYGTVSQSPSLARRILFWIRLAFMGSPHVEIAKAVERGRCSGRQTIAKIRKYEKDNGDR
jgi:glycosyltransferase involved in cell wall biosynthesis